MTLTIDKIMKGILIFFLVLLISFFSLWVVIEPMLRSSYMKGYDVGYNVGKEETCLYVSKNSTNYNEDMHEMPTGVNINISNLIS